MAFTRSLASRLLLLAAFAAPAIGALAAQSAPEKPLYVGMARARLVRLPDNAQTLLIGNPLVADVAMLRNNRLMVITGKSFGTTNLIMLDQKGTEVGEKLITVLDANDYLVVQRGMSRNSYSCTPECQPALDLGDDPEFTKNVLGAAKEFDPTKK